MAAIPSPTPYPPEKMGQFVPPTATSSRDCMADVTGRQINRATVGRLNPNHADIRKKSGAPSTRGLWISEAVDAAKAYGVTLTPYYGISRNDTMALVDGGRALNLLIDCSVTRYTTRRTNTYTGPHAVFVVAYNWWPQGEICGCDRKTAQAHGEFTIEDPGTTTAGYLQWSASLAYRAAEAYGSGRIYCVAAPDTEGRPWTAVGAADKRSVPSYSGGKKLGSLKVNAKYRGGRTEKGGNWKRDDGTYANGWVHLHDGTRWFWSKGESVR